MRIAVSVLILSLTFLGCRQEKPKEQFWTPFLNEDARVVDSLLSTLSPQEKIGQLILLRSEAKDSAVLYHLLEWVEEVKIGGLLLTGLPVLEFADLVDCAQQESMIPLMIGTTERIITNNQFADAVALEAGPSVDALPDDALRKRLLDYYFAQVRSLGINFWMDSGGSFGFDGKQDGDLFAQWLSVLTGRRLLSMSNRLPAAVHPFSDTSFIPASLVSEHQQAVRAGLSAMVIDSAFFQEKQPGPFPPRFWQGYLEQNLSFHGLNVAVVSGMESLHLSLSAGADLFLVDGDASALHRRLLQLYERGILDSRRLDASVRKVLLAKQWMREDAGAGEEESRLKPLRAMKASIIGWPRASAGRALADSRHLEAHFHSSAWRVLDRRIFEEALTVASNAHWLVPLEIGPLKFKLLQYSRRPFDEFESFFGKYADFETLIFEAGENGRLPSPAEQLEEGDLGIVLLDEYQLNVRRDSVLIKDLQRLGEEGRLILVNFREPSRLAAFDSTLTVVQLYERNDLNEQLAAQLLFGAVRAPGRLPVTVNDYFTAGKGHGIGQVRLQYSIPEAVGIAPEKLVGIDAIALTAIDEQAMPGCQVVVAKSGKIIYSKSFGQQTYKGGREVQNTDLYDLASITKVAATTLEAMKLYDEKAFKLDDKLKDHLVVDRKSTIRNLSLRKIFIHQSGLQPHMPVVPFLLDRSRSNAKCVRNFCEQDRAPFTVQVAENFFFDRHNLDIIWQKVNRLRVGNQRKYRYSDVNLMLIQRMVEEKTGLPLDQLVERDFYRPLGLRNIGFKPREKFDLSQIVPTAYDRRWRRQLVHGFVHDETAALMGGVGGNAGLFSNAEDLVVLFQLLLNGGHYGGRRYLSPETVELFTSARHGNHRGLGFDKPFETNLSALAGDAPSGTYGHTGFTGTAVWVDPGEELIFAFLSNRVNPSARNDLLFKKMVRRRMHQVVYDGLQTFSDAIPELE